MVKLSAFHIQTFHPIIKLSPSVLKGLRTEDKYFVIADIVFRFLLAPLVYLYQTIG